MRDRKGTFIVSLDFEQYCGVRDQISFAEFKQTHSEDRSIICNILDLFEKYNIHATWAIVGMLFCKNGGELLHCLPDSKPLYKNGNLSPYLNMEDIIHEDGPENPYLFAPYLIRKIASTPYQEVASHTFSHYYCLEKGQNLENFKADIKMAIKIAKTFNLSITSIVFPRNQINPDYLPICADMGIKAYRGHHPHWIYKGDPLGKKPNFMVKSLRFLDLFFNILGHSAFSITDIPQEMPINIQASRFLRGYAKRLRFLKGWRLKRIKADLTYAAKKGLVYHLWWHPHDFAMHKDEKLLLLKNILEHFISLKEKYGMESLNMRELSQKLLDGEMRITKRSGSPSNEC